MPPTISWLASLNLRQLHRVAVLVGSPCSGTKPTRVLEIEKALHHVSQHKAAEGSVKKLSIVSIDMGIRNLAYCHLSSLTPAEGKSGVIDISTWQRQSIEDGPSTLPGQSDALQPQISVVPQNATPRRESYDPMMYAVRAHSFIRHIIDTHQPTHVLIERQRFRSGGQASVQEWTIRVGVFEAMLYAVLATFMAERHHSCQVIPILPMQVNRFWLPSGLENGAKAKAERLTASSIKLQKISLVEEILVQSSIQNNTLAFSSEAEQTKSNFLLRFGKKTRTPAASKIKLDDLSDSFLQGLGWIQWQQNRLRLLKMGQRAFDLC